MLAVRAAAVLLGAGGFSISVAGSLRARRTQSAADAALGVGKNAQAGQLRLEQVAPSLPAAAAGLARTRVRDAGPGGPGFSSRAR
jgi:hypothetical protein